MSSSSFQRWYEAHKEEYNAKRRQRYAADRDYRSKQKASTKAWRQRTPVRRPPRTYLSIGEFATAVGCYLKTLRNLELQGLLPVTTDGQRHRRYHPDNVPWVKALVEYRKNTPYQQAGYTKEVQRLSRQVFRHWKEA